MKPRPRNDRPNERNPIQDSPPQNVDAEKGVLCSIMLEPKTAIDECVKTGMESNWFFVPAHQTIYVELRDMWDSSGGIDLITFTNWLRGKKLLDSVGGAGAVADVQTFVPSAALLPHYIGIVRDMYVRRQIIDSAALAAGRAYNSDPNADICTVLDEISSRAMSLRSLHGHNGVQPLSWEELSKPADLTDTLLENRALERGQGAIVFGPAGCGKSTAGFQMCACWSAGMAGIHIAPPRPLRIVILQTEDSRNDLREYCDGILSQACFTKERITLVKKNLIVMPPVPGGSPEDLRRLLNNVATRFHPDLISLNPLLAFCAADYTRELGAMLYQVIDPVIKKYHLGFLGIHHTTKPIYKDTSGYGAYDYQYLAAGDARIANWPRLGIQIDPVATNPVLTACFRITKRWQRIPWLNEKGEPTRELYLKHSAEIWWADASQEEAESARATEDPRKILEVLPPPSETGIPREKIRVKAKNELHVGGNKADDWLKIEVHDGLVERYEDVTAGKRKIALFRRAYE